MIPAPASSSTHPWGDADTPYAEIGGMDRVRYLVDSFYDIIEKDSPVLHEMLPSDTSISRTKLFEFMTGWLGGPPLYIEKRGHPRLRMRHFPFSIGDYEAAEWMRCMSEAIDETGIVDPLRAFLIEKLGVQALHMRNQI